VLACFSSHPAGAGARAPAPDLEINAMLRRTGFARPCCFAQSGRAS
jgi:hypothetical protein